MIKIKESEFDYQCSQQHSKPILAIALLQKFSFQNALLCADCIQNLENNTKTLGWRKAVEKIELDLENKVQATEKIISPFLSQLKEFQSKLEQLKIVFLKEIDSLQLIIDQWKSDLQNEKQKFEYYNFVKELEYVVQQEIQQNINNQSLEDQISNNISEVNSKWIAQVQLKLTQLKEFEQWKSCQEKIKQVEKQVKTQIIELKKQLKLPLIKLDYDQERWVQYYQYDIYQMDKKYNYNQIIFIGQKNQGKTTLIDAFVNYYFDIKYDDNFRLKVSNNESTSQITYYYLPPYDKRTQGIKLVDTPGFRYQNDQEIMNQIINLILDCKNQLALVFCLKAQTTRNIQEQIQTLQNIFKVLGKNQNIKLIIALTLYSNENNDIIDNEDEIILNQLDLSYYLKINADNILTKSLDYNSKKQYEQNIEKLKMIEFAQEECDLSISVQLDIVSQTVQNKMNYQKIFNQSYSQLKKLFMQNVQVYIKNKHQQYTNNMIRFYYLKKMEIQTNTFSFNCDYHVFTCLTGFLNQNDAEDFWVILNKQCICGCTPQRISIKNLQIVYEEDSTVTNNNEVYQENLLSTKLAVRRIFYFLFKLYILKSQDHQCQQNTFFEMIKNEEKYNDNNNLEYCQQVCLGQINIQQNVQQNYQQYMIQNNNQHSQQNLPLNTQPYQDIDQNYMFNNQQFTPQKMQQTNNKQNFFFNNVQQGQQTQNIPQLIDKQRQMQYYPILNQPNYYPGQYCQSPQMTTNNQLNIQNTMRF